MDINFFEGAIRHTKANCSDLYFEIAPPALQCDFEPGITAIKKWTVLVQQTSVCWNPIAADVLGMACPAYYFHKLGSTIFIQKLDLLKAFWTLGQLQLFLVGLNGCRSARLNAGSFAVNPGLMVWIVAVIPGSKFC